MSSSVRHEAIGPTDSPDRTVRFGVLGRAVAVWVLVLVTLLVGPIAVGRWLRARRTGAAR
ncbi:MAG: hypothetical protein U5J98_02575 [Halobacteriales archaeon]|nr:hypothetical protein [Halobacteriales archaeon]